MKFSVITPAFNGMSHIRKCIGSVRNQVSESIEVEHFVQDGVSKDGTAEFVQGFEQRGDVSDQKNYRFSAQCEADEGMYDAINKGWARADGDILSWLNADEQYLPGTLEKVASYFEAHPEVDVVWGEFICVDKVGQPTALRRDIPVRQFYMKNCRCYVASCTAFYRRRIWDDGELRMNDAYRFSSDRELYLRLMDRGIRFLHVHEYFSLFELADQNLSVVHFDSMHNEYLQISRLYGGGGRFIRMLAKVIRGIERFLQGCYFSKDILCRYVIDESGRSEERIGLRVSYKMNYSGH